MIHTIKPIEELSLDEIAALAHAAAARFDAHANPFATGTKQFTYYELQYVLASCEFA